MGFLMPVLKTLPQFLVKWLIKDNVASAVFGTPSVGKELRMAVAKHKKEAYQEGDYLVVTGHSLGAVLVGAVSAQENVEGVGFSAPGLLFQSERLGINLFDLQFGFTNIQPSNDVVPRVDSQRGMIQWIRCVERPFTCHMIKKTSCELWSQCGDPRGRDWRRLCSEFGYSRSQMNI